MQLPDRGRLGVLPLPALLLLLQRARFGGRLQLDRDAASRSVELRDGRPIRIRGAELTLCARLVAAGRLSPEDAARATAQTPKYGGCEEKALLALQLLKLRDLYLALREHEREALLECFAWPDGLFELTPGDVAPAEAVAFGHDPVALVHAGISGHWSPERTAAALGAAGSRFAAPGPGFEEACTALRGLPGFDALRERLDGRVRLLDAAREAGPPGAFAAALVLDALGALRYSDEPAQAAHGDEAPWAAETAPEIEIVTARGGSDAEANAASAGGAATAAPDARQAEADGVRRALLEMRNRLEELDYYALLGVAPKAETAAIRRAYVSAAKTFHPDVVARLGLEDLREAANLVFARISKAHAVLSDPAQRLDYDESLAGRGAEDVQRIALAETQFRKGEVLLRTGRFDEALPFLRAAVDALGDEAAYRCALGWALYKKKTPDPEAACAELQRAVELDPADPIAHQRLGTLLRALGKAAEASAQFARAQELNNRAAKAR